MGDIDVRNAFPKYYTQNFGEEKFVDLKPRLEARHPGLSMLLLVENGPFEEIKHLKSEEENITHSLMHSWEVNTPEAEGKIIFWEVTSLETDINHHLMRQWIIKNVGNEPPEKIQKVDNIYHKSISIEAHSLPFKIQQQTASYEVFQAVDQKYSPTFRTPIEIGDFRYYNLDFAKKEFRINNITYLPSESDFINNNKEAQIFRGRMIPAAWLRAKTELSGGPSFQNMSADQKLSTRIYDIIPYEAAVKAIYYLEENFGEKDYINNAKRILKESVSGTPSNNLHDHIERNMLRSIDIVNSIKV